MFNRLKITTVCFSKQKLTELIQAVQMIKHPIDVEVRCYKMMETKISLKVILYFLSQLEM